MGNMISRKDVDYFEMFAKGISISLKAAQKLRCAFADGVINESELKVIKDIEHEGDKHVHECLKVIDVAFITPIDRTDIVEILKCIENITDSIDAVSNHIYMMYVTQSNVYLRKFVDLCVCSCEKLHELTVALKKFKKNPELINELIVEVNHLEEEGDRTYAESMRDLFGNETNAVEIIKLKEIYRRLEKTLDCCEDVADMVQKIMIAKT